MSEISKSAKTLIQKIKKDKSLPESFGGYNKELGRPEAGKSSFTRQLEYAMSVIDRVRKTGKPSSHDLSGMNTTMGTMKKLSERTKDKEVKSLASDLSSKIGLLLQDYSFASNDD